MSAPVEIRGQVIGGEELAMKIIDMGGLIRTRLAAAVQKGGLQILRDTKGHFLSGAALKVRTGRLRRSVNHKFEDMDEALVSSVGTNVVYGRFWELGYTGPVKVRPHVRRVERRSSYSIKNKKQAAQGIAFVRGHVRNVHAEPRPFLQPSLNINRDEIRARLVAAISPR